MATQPDPFPNNIDSALKSFAGEGGLPIRINGNCMAPLIKDGALVYVHKQNFYWPGDILVKRYSDGQLVSHRLIGFYPRKGNLNFVTRADNANMADPAAPGSRVIGRIAGGDCARSVAFVPVRSRIRAIGQFAALITIRLRHRLFS